MGSGIRVPDPVLLLPRHEGAERARARPEEGEERRPRREHHPGPGHRYRPADALALHGQEAVGVREGDPWHGQLDRVHRERREPQGHPGWNRRRRSRNPRRVNERNETWKRSIKNSLLSITKK